MALGRLATLALGAALLTREAAAVARDGGSGVGTSGVGHVGNGGTGVDGIRCACGAGGVCGCCGGGAGCFAGGVCGGVAGGPSRFSSTSSAMVVESKLDVELPTAPFWFSVRQTSRPVESRFGPKRGFGETPGELLTLKENLLLPQRGK